MRSLLQVAFVFPCRPVTERQKNAPSKWHTHFPLTLEEEAVKCDTHFLASDYIVVFSHVVFNSESSAASLQEHFFRFQLVKWCMKEIRFYDHTAFFHF